MDKAHGHFGTRTYFAGAENVTQPCDKKRPCARSKRDTLTSSVGREEQLSVPFFKRI